MKLTTGFLIFAASVMAIAADDSNSKSATWNPKTAASYLDQRQAWWITWPNSQRDHGSFCISCHTALPYALARPALRPALGESEASASERKILDDVANRVRLWDEVEPFYSDATRGVPKTAESRGTEAILNALILVSNNPSGADTHKAFENLWKLQQSNGAWIWLNFHNSPWEADDSQFFGASLTAVAIGRLPAQDRAAAKSQMESLRGYIQQRFKDESAMNRLWALWASAKWKGLLGSDQVDATLAELKSKQREDGGWCTSALVGDWKRHDNTPQDTNSDGYATGLISYVLEVTGLEPAMAAKGRAWLMSHQTAEGSWAATSLNKNRDPKSDAGRFMSDAATAYAVLALSR